MTTPLSDVKILRLVVKFLPKGIVTIDDIQQMSVALEETPQFFPFTLSPFVGESENGAFMGFPVRGFYDFGDQFDIIDYECLEKTKLALASAQTLKSVSELIPSAKVKNGPYSCISLDFQPQEEGHEWQIYHWLLDRKR